MNEKIGFNGIQGNVIIVMIVGERRENLGFVDVGTGRDIQTLKRRVITHA